MAGTFVFVSLIVGTAVLRDSVPRTASVSVGDCSALQESDKSPKSVKKTQERPLSAEEKTLLKEASILNQKAIALFKAGRKTEAIPLIEKALSIRKKVLGEKHLNYAIDLNNLAM